MIFETHAHYDDEAYNDDRESLINSLPEHCIEYVLNICSSIESVDRTIALTDEYSFIYSAIGIHPDSTKDLNEEKFIWLKNKTNHPKCLAVGEIGLDYYWDTTPRDIQIKWFERQIDLAKQRKLAIVFHSRDAAKDTFDIIKSNNIVSVGGVLHCYSYSKEQAKEYLDLGLYLGIGGVVTFNNAKKLKEVVEYAPLEQLVLETDAPYLSPVPHRGKRNTSINLSLIAGEIARIKNIDYETVVNVTNENAKKLFFKNTL
ncbi:MAG TPA: TatD family hydrolase [Clostridiales bacterium]|nr:TatD family hydrolase [Clostridiales bacterium]